MIWEKNGLRVPEYYQNEFELGFFLDLACLVWCIDFVPPWSYKIYNMDKEVQIYIYIYISIMMYKYTNMQIYSF